MTVPLPKPKQNETKDEFIKRSWSTKPCSMNSRRVSTLCGLFDAVEEAGSEIGSSAGLRNPYGGRSGRWNRKVTGRR